MLQFTGTCKWESAVHSFLASGPAIEKQASARADLEASWLGINWGNTLPLKLSFYSMFFPSTGSLKRMEAFGSHAFVRQCIKSPNHIIVSLLLSLLMTIYLSLSPLFLSLSLHTHTHTHFAFHFIIGHSISDNETNFEKIFYLFIFRNTPTIKNKQNS